MADRQTLSVQDAARVLTDSAAQMSAEEFAQLAEEVLVDNSPGEIEAIASYVPKALLKLLPKRTLQ